jgi:hypothetical protein
MTLFQKQAPCDQWQMDRWIKCGLLKKIWKEVTMPTVKYSKDTWRLWHGIAIQLCAITAFDAMFPSWSAVATTRLQISCGDKTK